MTRIANQPEDGRSGAAAPSGFRPTDGAASVSTAGAASIPNAGVCAYDIDECTVTLALDNAEQVRALVAAFPGKNRVRMAEDNGWEIFEAYRIGFNDGDQGDWNPDGCARQLNASAMSGSAQDAQRLDPKGASAVGDSRDAQEPSA